MKDVLHADAHGAAAVLGKRYNTLKFRRNKTLNYAKQKNCIITSAVK